MHVVDISQNSFSDRTVAEVRPDEYDSCSNKFCPYRQPRQFIWMCKGELASCDLSNNQIVRTGRGLVFACILAINLHELV